MSAYPPPTYYFSGIQFNSAFYNVTSTTSSTTNTFPSGILTNSIDTIISPDTLNIGSTNAEMVAIKNNELVVGTDSGAGKDYVSVDKCYFTTGTSGEATIDTKTAVPLHIAPSTTVEPSAVCSSVVIGNSTIPVTINGNSVTLSSLKTDVINRQGTGTTALQIASTSPNLELGYYTSGSNFTATKLFGKFYLQANAIMEGISSLNIATVTTNTNIGYVGSVINIIGYLKANTINAYTSGALLIGSLSTTTSVSIQKQLTLSNPLILGTTPTADTELGYTLLTTLSTNKLLGTPTGQTTSILTSASIPIGVYTISYAIRINASATTTSLTTIQAGLTLNGGNFYATSMLNGTFPLDTGVNNIGLSGTWCGKITTAQTIELKTYSQYTGSEPQAVTSGQGTYFTIVRIA